MIFGCSDDGCRDSGPPVDPLHIVTPSLPNGVVGTAYNATVLATGGSVYNSAHAYGWSVSRGSLPAGLSLNTVNNTGQITGTPTAVGSSTFTLSVRDKNPNGIQGDDEQRSITIQASVSPVPQITSLSPASAMVGSPDLTLTIDGTNFIGGPGGSTVNFGPNLGSPPSTVTSASLTIVIPAAEMATAGPVLVTVSNPAPGGGTSNSLTFTVTPSATFRPGPILDPGNTPALDDAGDIAVVGETDGAVGAPAIASVFALVNGNWSLAAQLRSPTGIASVAISGDGKTIVIGDCRDDTCNGQAYVYVAPPAGWTGAASPMIPTATLTTTNGAQQTRIGYSVAIDHLGETVAVGAPCDLQKCGSVYVFIAPQGWATRAAPHEDAQLTDSPSLGYSVSIDSAGVTIAAGDPKDGNVDLFLMQAGGWKSVSGPDAQLTANELFADGFARSVAISGDGSTLVVGAPLASCSSPPCTPGPGEVEVFVKPSGGWRSFAQRTLRLIPGDGVDGDQFGDSVSVDAHGARIAVGAPRKVFLAGGPFWGAAYVFQSGVQIQSLAAFAGNDVFGNAVIPESSFGGGAFFDSMDGVSLSGDGTTLLVGGLATVNGTASRQVADLFQLPSGPTSSSVAITTGPLPSVAVGAAYNVQFFATGGTLPYHWVLASLSTTLPPGLTLGTDGALTGTATIAGDYEFLVQVMDSAAPASAATAAFAIKVLAPLAITTASVPAATEGQAYSTVLQATGGTTPYSWAVTNGVLPSGIDLSPGGTLGGTPLASGTFDFTVQVTDLSNPNQSASRAFSLDVAAASGLPSLPGPFVLEPDQAVAATTTPIVGVDEAGDTAVMAVTRAGGGTVAAQVFARDSRGQMDFATLLTNIESAQSGGVAISGDGNTIAVDFVGQVRVMTKPNTPQGWFDPNRTSFSALLQQSHPQMGDNFGYSIAIDETGSTIVVGAPCSLNLRCGTVYVYKRPAAGWTTIGQTETASLNATVDLGVGPVPVRSLGFAVGIDGTGQNIIAGAPDFLPQATGAGNVYLFHLPVSGWATTSTPTAKLSASDGVNSDQLGWSAAISFDGSTVVAGAPGNPATQSPPTGPGAAYVFLQPSGGWGSLGPSSTRTEDAKLVASQGNPNDGLGQSVSATTNGSMLVVGAPNAPFSNGQPGGGRVYAYQVPAGGWRGGAGHPVSEALIVTEYAGKLNGWFSSGNIACTPAGGFAATQGLSISADASTLIVGGLANTAPTVPPPPIQVLYEYR